MPHQTGSLDRTENFGGWWEDSFHFSGLCSIFPSMYICKWREVKKAKKKKIKLLNCVPVFIQAGESENLEIVLRYFVSVP